MNSEFFVQKETGTSADTLLAFGLARLIGHIRGYNDLTIKDMGDTYCVFVNKPITFEEINQTSFASFCDGVVVTTKKGRQDVDVPSPMKKDYEEHKRRNQLFYESLGSDDEDQLAQIDIVQPHPDWPIWAVINHMSAMTTYNQLIELWYKHRDYFSELVEIILSIFQHRVNDVDTALAKWKVLAKSKEIEGKFNASKLQVINPSTGKGFNRGKADRLPSPKGLSGFWVLEYLKFAGFYKTATSRVIKGENIEDRKTYILQPKEINWLTHELLFEQFRERLFAQTAVKMDVVSALRYCQLFIEQWRDGQGGGLLDFMNGSPGDHVSGIEITHYKKLKAFVTLNMSNFSLPLWLTVNSIEDANQYLDILEEHIQIVNQKHSHEQKGHEYAFLRDYRDFLSGYDLQSFYQFMRLYIKHITSQLTAKVYVPQFTIQNLEVLIMKHDKKLTPILNNTGFRKIAEAIRLSTVRPMFQKANNLEPIYEIRYGLGDKLLRNARDRNDFVQELGRFIHTYNRENNRKRKEATVRKQIRMDVSSNDIENIIALIDDENYDVNTIASLLVSFGYAYDSSYSKKKEDAVKEVASQVS